MYYLASGAYPIRQPLYLAGWLLLIGPSGVFWLSFVALLVSFAAVRATLHTLDLLAGWAGLVFSFFPAKVLSHNLMSDVPSMALVALWLSVFVRLPRSVSSTVVLCLPRSTRLPVPLLPPPPSFQLRLPNGT